MSEGRIMKKGKSMLFAAAAAVASVLGSAGIRSANAAPINLSNGNSSVVINPIAPGATGITNWTVNGTNEVNNISDFYSTGSGAPIAVGSLNEVSAPTVLNTSGGSGNDYANIIYADAAKSFQLSLTYQLTGGQPGSKVSDLGETAQIINTSSATLNYHFYEYSNFNLGGTTGGQTVTMTGGNTATQSGNFTVAETVVSPHPNEFQAASYPTLTTALNGSSALTLNDTASASGDGEWANQWDVTLAPGQAYVLSADQQIRATVPEPASTMAFLALGGLVLTRPRRRDEDADPRTAAVAEA